MANSEKESILQLADCAESEVMSDADMWRSAAEAGLSLLAKLVTIEDFRDYIRHSVAMDVRAKQELETVSLMAKRDVILDRIKRSLQ